MSDEPSSLRIQERLAAWRYLASGEATSLVGDADAALDGGLEVGDLARLRRRHPDEPVNEALELVQARRKAQGRLDGVDRLLLDRHGSEQATGSVVANWKARRFGGASVIDLCSGIGGDSIALAARGPCRAVDRDPVRAFMTSVNAGIEGIVGDVREIEVSNDLVHIDPARRDESTGRRHWRLEDLSPDPEVIRSIAGRASGAAIKLGPGLPRPFPVLHERQSVSIVSEGGRLVQAVVWTGSLAGDRSVEAVDLPSGDEIAGEPEEMPTGGAERLSPGAVEPGREPVLVQFHPAVERASLGPTAWRRRFGDAELLEPAVGLGIGVTRGEEIASSARGSSRWIRLTGVRAIERPRLDEVEKAVVGLIGDGPPPNRVVVRTRASAVDADAWTRRLARLADPSTPGEVVEIHGIRIGRRIAVMIGSPLVGPGQESAGAS
ncbi:MAG: hypothetical protein CMJ34_03915 [Phycisphaerae bacterium]|nr:hypothetical protein [Phycisphaerae bacterium]